MLILPLQSFKIKTNEFYLKMDYMVISKKWIDKSNKQNEQGIPHMVQVKPIGSDSFKYKDQKTLKLR